MPCTGQRTTTPGRSGESCLPVEVDPATRECRSSASMRYSTWISKLRLHPRATGPQLVGRGVGHGTAIAGFSRSVKTRGGRDGRRCPCARGRASRQGEANLTCFRNGWFNSLGHRAAALHKLTGLTGGQQSPHCRIFRPHKDPIHAVLLREVLATPRENDLVSQFQRAARATGREG